MNICRYGWIGDIFGCWICCWIGCFFGWGNGYWVGEGMLGGFGLWSDEIVIWNLLDRNDLVVWVESEGYGYK